MCIRDSTLGKLPKDLFAEFDHTAPEELPSGDVKYHQGFSSDVSTRGGPVHLTLAFNPSHLEIVNPVVEGMSRAAGTFADEAGAPAAMADAGPRPGGCCGRVQLRGARHQRRSDGHDRCSGRRRPRCLWPDHRGGRGTGRGRRMAGGVVFSAAGPSSFGVYFSP